jgi:hypothetical protein
VAVWDGESEIQLIETLESDDPHADPEHQATREDGRAKFRRAFERLSPARCSRCRRAASCRSTRS